MGKLFAPNGAEIIGTFETVHGIGQIVDVTPMVDGEYGFDWGGGTVMLWDGQVTETDPMSGQRLFIDAEHCVWQESELTYKETEDAKA